MVKVILKDYDIIKYPIFSEKSTMMSENGKYFFVVDPKATKIEIKDAIERIFNVKVSSVNTLIRKGKKKVFRGKSAILSDVKRAFVSLKEGKIVFEGGI